MRFPATLLFALLLWLSPARSSAQGAAFAEGRSYVNIGLGLGTQYGGGLPIGLAYDRGITNRISLGFQIDYYAWTYRTGSFRYNYRFAPIGLRAAYHFNDLGDPAKVDLYAGVAAGYIASRFRTDAPSVLFYDDNYRGRLFGSIFAGARYFFAPQVGVFGELGYGVAWLKVGATLAF